MDLVMQFMVGWAVGYCLGLLILWLCTELLDRK